MALGNGKTNDLLNKQFYDLIYASNTQQRHHHQKSERNKATTTNLLNQR